MNNTTNHNSTPQATEEQSPKLTSVNGGQNTDTRLDEFNSIMSRMLDADPDTSKEGFDEFDAFANKIAPRAHLSRVK